MDKSGFSILISAMLLITACTPRVETTAPTPSPNYFLIKTLTAPYRPTATIAKTPSLVSTIDSAGDCAAVERLAPDSAEAQQIVEEFVASYKEQYPTEYMGMAILDGVDRLGEWAVVQGSVSGEGKDVIAVRQTPQGYQIAERYIITAPLESFDEPEKLVPEYFLERLPDAPQALFTCLDQSWLLAVGYPGEPPGVFQLAYVGTDGFTSEGVTEIKTIHSDGSNPDVLLHEAMLIMGLASSPDGERMAFWGCPGSLANDCLSGEDLDLWVMNWDGSNLRNLTEDSAADDSHPDWSPDGRQIVFDSRRSGKAEIYVMRADGSGMRQITERAEDNREAKWSPDGKWISFHCGMGGETQICVVSPDGKSAGEAISGTTPVWQPASVEGEARLAFLCFEAGQSDICTARPDGSDLENLTDGPSDEHSAAWSPDGNWIAFVSNRGDDIDVYKVCATCPGEPSVVRLTDEPRPAGWPAWSPDGSRVAYESAGDLLVVNADRSGVTYLTSGVFGPPIWRPYLFTPPPTAILTSVPTPTTTPTPLFAFEPDGYDPDLFPPIDVAHNPPLIARRNETVRLVFDLVNTIYCTELQRYCRLEPTLSYTYGEGKAFQSIPLTYEIVNEMDSLVARLPATDPEGRSLRYYAEFAVPEADYTQRYPAAGTIDLFTIDGFIPVELEVENAVKPGEEVYDFFWGYGPDKVLQGYYREYLTRVGPPAMDVSDEGKIALIDPFNERIILFDPGEGSYSSYPLPFTHGFYADLAFDPEGRLMVCDYQGEEVEETLGPDPYCYLLLPDGTPGESTPVYVRSPAKMTEGLKILDYADSRLVAPFDSEGRANSREIQRQKKAWEFPLLYPEGGDPYLAHYADVKEGLAFEVHSASPLGVLTDFEKTPQGYLMTFSLGDRIRGVWIDPAGNVLKDVTLPKGAYSEINFNGQAAVAPDGSLYAMSSTERGIEIHFVRAP
jgi:Tol biopolymer transport system component